MITQSLEPWMAHLPAWTLVLFRLSGIFIFAPVFGSQAIPGRVKIFLALGLSLCVYPMLLGAGNSGVMAVLGSRLNLWTLPVAVAMELLIGLVIGYTASLPLVGLQIGGRVIDQQLGLGLAGVLNPDFNEQTGIVSEILFVVTLAVFLILGGHRVLLLILVGSFDGVPLGGFSADTRLLELMIGLLSTVFELGLRVAAPILCLIFLETVAMGFIARTVPQMNILSVGFALRILMGGGLMVAAIGVITRLGAESMWQTLGELMRFFMR